MVCRSAGIYSNAARVRRGRRAMRSVLFRASGVVEGIEGIEAATRYAVARCGTFYCRFVLQFVGYPE